MPVFAETNGSLEGSVIRGIEDCLLVVRTTLNKDITQGGVPFITTFLDDFGHIKRLALLSTQVLLCLLLAYILPRVIKKKKLPRKAWFIIVPAVVYFIGIALVSPFNSDRYVMACLPLLSLLFTFAFIRLITMIHFRAGVAVPVCLLAASALAFTVVKPYYIYGETNLYQPKTDKCVFVGTAMMEWNKCIDKFMNYDSVMIAKTTSMSATLYDELDAFAQARGVITNGKVGAIAKSFMNNGSVERTETDSLGKLVKDKELNGLSEVTVYISRLADEKTVTDAITKNTGLKHYELIQKDRQFEEFFNWYDYFVETESYCNVYRFYK